MYKIRDVVRGKTIDGKVVISGKEIFKLMDTYGFPMDLIYEILDNENIIFDAYEFIFFAKKSGNFSKKKIHNILSILPYYDDKIFCKIIDFIFTKKSMSS